MHFIPRSGIRNILILFFVIFFGRTYGAQLQSILQKFKIESSLVEPCKGKGECFSGAWLGHISHLLDNPKLDDFFPGGHIDSARSQVRCEDASFFFFHKMFDTRVNDTFGESPVQTIDMFDFSVLHLSSTERLLHKFIERSKEGWALHKREMDRTLKTLSVFINSGNQEKTRDLALDKLAGNSLTWTQTKGKPLPEASLVDPPQVSVEEQLERTLVVVPFLLGLKGESGTMNTYRKRNLQLTFWSLYPIFKNIMGAVVTEADQRAAKLMLPFKEVMLFEAKYPRAGTCGLPMAAILEVRNRLKNDPLFRSQFDYFYFSEGDQILVTRKLPQIYSYLSANPYRVLAPHRLVVLSPLAIDKIGRARSSITRIPQYPTGYSCCFDTGSYGATRVHWKTISSPEVTIATVFGAYVVAGNTNFFNQSYRSCNITARVDACRQDSTTETYLAYTDAPEIFMKHFRNRVASGFY